MSASVFLIRRTRNSLALDAVPLVVRDLDATCWHATIESGGHFKTMLTLAIANRQRGKYMFGDNAERKRNFATGGWKIVSCSEARCYQSLKAIMAV